jgi:UPF0716 protein FxsA
MLAKLSLLFTLVTAAELTILIPLSKAVGLLPTAGIIVGTAVLGASLAKRQGSAVWSRIQDELGSGGLPGDSLLDGIGVLIAGAFLLTPGVLTDIAGIGLLIPWVRAPIKSLAKDRLKKKLESSSVSYIEHRTGSVDSSHGRWQSEESPTEAEVIDVPTDDRDDSNDGSETDRDPTTDQMTAGV